MLFNEDDTKHIMKFKKVKMKADHLLIPDDPMPPPFKYIRSGFCMAITGPSSSGKSNALIQIIGRNRKNGQRRSLKNVFHTITIVSPSLHTLGKNIFEDLPDIYKHTQLTEETMHSYNDMIQQQKEEYEEGDEPIFNLLILDDVGRQLRKSKINDLFETLVNNRRHSNTSIIMCLQFMKQIPPSIRTNLSYLFSYKPKALKEEEDIYEYTKKPKKNMREFFETFYRNKRDIMLIDMTLNDSFDFIIYRNFNKITF